MRYGRCAPLIGMIAAALGGIASAQPVVPVPGFNLEKLELDPFAVGSLVVGSGRLLAPGALRISVVGHYERNPLLIRLESERTAAVVRDRVATHVTLGLGLHPRVSLGAELPIVLRQTSDDLSAVGVASPMSQALGTPVIAARAGVLQNPVEDPLELAVELAVGLPIGSGDALAGSSNATVSPKLLVSKQIDPVLVSVDASALFQSRQSLGSQEVGNQLIFGAAVSTVAGTVRGELSWRSYVSLTGLPAAHELLGGGRLVFGRGLQLFALGGPGIGASLGSPAFRILAGMAWGTEPSAAAGAEAEANNVCQPGRAHLPSQCPDLDDDGDGIKNAVDKCPTEPEDFDGFQDEDGCPEPDNDGDGIPDTIDRCPNTKGVAELAGCPVLDSDGDGIPDHLDLCPNEPGPAETRGCPIRDSDGDGVPDHLDNCPHEPGPASNQGCPVKEKQLVVLTAEKLVIREKVYFASNKATILPRSYPLLDQVARVITAHRELPSIIIEGHTDTRGNAATNRRLSQARANAVRAYLMQKGVPASRLKAKGYGPDRPAETNMTARGREANRRVEFIIGPPTVDTDILAPLVPSGESPDGKDKVKK